MAAKPYIQSPVRRGGREGARLDVNGCPRGDGDGVDAIDTESGGAAAAVDTIVLKEWVLVCEVAKHQMVDADGEGGGAGVAPGRWREAAERGRGRFHGQHVNIVKVVPRVVPVCLAGSGGTDGPRVVLCALFLSAKDTEVAARYLHHITVLHTQCT